MLELSDFVILFTIQFIAVFIAVSVLMFASLRFGKAMIGKLLTNHMPHLFEAMGKNAGKQYFYQERAQKGSDTRWGKKPKETKGNTDNPYVDSELAEIIGEDLAAMVEMIPQEDIKKKVIDGAKKHPQMAKMIVNAALNPGQPPPEAQQQIPYMQPPNPYQNQYYEFQE